MSQIVVGTWRVSYLSYKALFGWLTWTSYISNIVVRPLLMVSLFALLGRFVESSPKEIEAYILGMSCFWIGATLTSGIIQCFYYERVLGTLHLAMASPINRPYLYFSRAFAHLPNGLMSFVSAIVWAWVLLGLDLSNANWWALALSVAAILASTACFAPLCREFCRRHARVDQPLRRRSRFPDGPYGGDRSYCPTSLEARISQLRPASIPRSGPHQGGG